MDSRRMKMAVLYSPVRSHDFVATLNVSLARNNAEACLFGESISRTILYIDF
jgi:hypothetical protein